MSEKIIQSSKNQKWIMLFLLWLMFLIAYLDRVNIAIAGPESAAMLLVPPYLLWIRMARPFIAFYDLCAKLVLRVFGVEAKNELENTVSTIELSEMIAESLSEGLLDPEEQKAVRMLLDAFLAAHQHRRGGEGPRSRKRPSR